MMQEQVQESSARACISGNTGHHPARAAQCPYSIEHAIANIQIPNRQLPHIERTSSCVLTTMIASGSVCAVKHR